MDAMIYLSEEWLSRATEAGRQRQDYARSRNLKHYGNKADYSVGKDIIGCIGECAAAKFFGLKWSPQIGVYNAVDVGGVLEVRARNIPGTGRDMAYRPDDKDHLPYVLVHVFQDNGVRLIGWLYGHEAREAGPWCEAKRVWFVPPPYRDIASLAIILQT